HAGITQVGFGDAVWGDYDGDGKPDLLVMGRKETHALLPDPFGNPNLSVQITPDTGFAAIYHNNGDSTFSKVQQFPGFEHGRAAWVDINNDGKLDVALVGITMDDTLQGPTQITHSKIYRNDGGTFTSIGDLLPIYRTGGTLAIADYDSDGRLDIATSGMQEVLRQLTLSSALIDSPYTNILHNVSDSHLSMFFPDTSTLPGNIPDPVPQVRYSAMDWADFDGDGKPDLLLSGEVLPDNNPPVPFTDILKNNGDGTFTALNAGLP